MNTRGSGVAIQVQETLAGRLALNPHAHRAVVEEQTGIQVVRQVDQQLHAAFIDLGELALRALALILLGPALALAPLDDHAAFIDVQCLRNGRQRIEHTRRGFFRVNGFGRCILLNVHPVVVQINRHRVFRHVCIVDTVAIDAFALDPFAQGFEVLLQTIGEHLPAFAQTRLLNHNGNRLDRVTVLVEFFVFTRCFNVGRQIGLSLLALSLTLLRGTTLTRHELVRHDLDQQQLARQGAVPE